MSSMVITKISDTGPIQLPFMKIQLVTKQHWLIYDWNQIFISDNSYYKKIGNIAQQKF